MSIKIAAAALALWFQSGTSHPPFECGQKKMVRRPYGNVRFEVDCKYRDMNRLGTAEYKGSKQHGIQVDYDSLWRKIVSVQYREGKEHGERINYDSNGNEVGIAYYRKGVNIGKDSMSYSPGRPMYVKHYDSKGKEHGPWLEWWPNGNKRKELEMNRGMLRHSMEWFPDGKPRQKYSVHYRKAKDGIMTRRISSKENWAFDGRPAGKVVNGVGEVLIFQLDEEDRRMKEVIREVYRDSVVKDVEVLDTAQAYRRLDSLAGKK